MIFAHKPMVTDVGSAVNICFQNGDKIVSLALDDSCGRMELLRRGDIELHRKTADGVDDCTSEVFDRVSEGPIPLTDDSFEMAMNWLGKSEWGFDAQRANLA